MEREVMYIITISVMVAPTKLILVEVKGSLLTMEDEAVIDKVIVLASKNKNDLEKKKKVRI